MRNIELSKAELLRRLEMVGDYIFKIQAIERKHNVDNGQLEGKNGLSIAFFTTNIMVCTDIENGMVDAENNRVEKEWLSPSEEEEQEDIVSGKTKKVKAIIQALKDIDVDGETMEHIIDEVGGTEQMLRQLVLKRPYKETSELLVEKVAHEVRKDK
jgi:hypothetical protein